MDFIIGVLFFAFFGGGAVWSWGCYACCAMMVTSPVGALLCRSWARRQDLDIARCARRGALYWAAGLMPWVYFAFQIKGRTVPRRRMKAIYAALFFAWLWGPIITGFFLSDSPDREFLAWVSITSLLAWIASLVCLAFAEVLPANRQRVHILHLIPSLLGSLAMLTWLPYRWLP